MDQLMNTSKKLSKGALTFDNLFLMDHFLGGVNKSSNVNIPLEFFPRGETFSHC